MIVTVVDAPPADPEAEGDAPSPEEPDTEQPVRARAATERAAKARCGVQDMAVLL